MSGLARGQQRRDVSVVLYGQAGQGVPMVEYLLTHILEFAGYHVLATQGYMSRVRGGLKSTTIRVSSWFEAALYRANAGVHKQRGTMIEKIGLDEFKQTILGAEAVSAPHE